jgi:hypothetical protein
MSTEPVGIQDQSDRLTSRNRTPRMLTAAMTIRVIARRPYPLWVVVARVCWVVYHAEELAMAGVLVSTW